jgi:GTPase SAR1 family protein
MVRTRSVEAFLATARQLPTGAIGLAGPRGVGKTSLIEHFAGYASNNYSYPRALKVTVSAPVQYEPRDFVLHLFATVCQAVLRERLATPIGSLSSLSVQVVATAVAVALAASVLDYLWLDQAWAPIAATGATMVAAMVPLVVNMVREHRRGRKASLA